MDVDASSSEPLSETFGLCLVNPKPPLSLSTLLPPQPIPVPIKQPSEEDKHQPYMSTQFDEPKVEGSSSSLPSSPPLFSSSLPTVL
jgi:hypothetical protein